MNFILTQVSLKVKVVNKAVKRGEFSLPAKTTMLHVGHKLIIQFFACGLKSFTSFDGN
jgi:hypothetical protein